MKVAPTINVLIGANNAGKSTVLRSLQLFQHAGLDNRFMHNAIRVGHEEGGIGIEIHSPNSIINDVFRLHNTHASMEGEPSYFCRLIKENQHTSHRFRLHYPALDSAIDTAHQTGILNVDGKNLFIYFLSKRKVGSYQFENNFEASFSVRDDFRNLNAKVSRVKNSMRAVVDEFNEYSERILGIDFCASPVQQGVEAGISLGDTVSIPVSSMGEGTANILALIYDLCMAPAGKIFLIEELENDLHPQALKALLDLIISKSEKHQFFVSTHSNIVLRYLGGLENSKVFEFKMKYVERIPTTTITSVEDEYERQEALRALGYEPFDFGLWAGYVILEESSAQAVIENILIPHFAPALKGKVKFISSNTASQVEAQYVDFHRLFVYLHKSEIYENASWVVVDGDNAGKEAIEKLKERFKNANPETLITLSQHAFEFYYPERFQSEARAALAIQNKKEKMAAKAKLVEEVKVWAKENPELAKTEFEKSAAEVINILKTIKESLKL